MSELGRVLLSKNDLDGAEEAFVTAHEVGWDAQPGLALVQLARGDLPGAATAIREALARPSFTPSKELPPDNDLHRFPLLEAQVAIGVTAGGEELVRARAASNELMRIAQKFMSKPFQASAMVARGRILLDEGRGVDAADLFESAARAFNEAGAPYEAARARIELARARRASGQEAAAELELRAARASFERLGIASPGASDPASVLSTTRPPPAANALIREGDTWAISFDGRTIRIADRKGMQYLARLLDEPRHAHHVLDLAGAHRAESPIDIGDAGPHLDATAKQAYRRWLAEIDGDIDEAERNSDLGRVERARHEREIVVKELSRAYGIGGHERPGVGSPVERARVSVTRALRQVIARLAEHHPSLGAHLDATIQTGTFCTYALEPSSEIVWRIERT